MMKKKSLYILVSAPLLAFMACSTDAGYAPSSQYDDKKVDYIVAYDDSYSGSVNERLPECDDKLEGYIFYAEKSSTVYACADGFWVVKRSLSKDAPELFEATRYNPGNTKKETTVNIPHEVASITDSRDGRKYKTVIIDDMEWMAENLDYDDEESNRVARQCSAKFGEKNCRQYRIYYAVGGGTENTLSYICPNDFHVPYEYEWEQLFDAVGGEEVAGRMLKDESFYTNYDYRGVNAISFSVLATGHGASKYESYIGEAAAFRTATGSVVTFGAASNRASIVSTISYFDGEYTNFSGVGSSDYYSVRCVREAW